ncbi:MAG: diguanylate cyclase [Simkaniaceae bacterium]|nr:diguanylate cyclase [Simkaniaceae bacterium]
MQIIQDFTPPLILIFTRASLHVQFLRECLRKGKQYDLVEATSDQACLEMLSNLSVNFLIFDERLVSEELEVFLKSIKEISGYEKLPILMISRNLKKPFVDQVKKFGVSAILREPLDENEILTSLKKCDPKKQIERKISKIAARIPSPEQDPELDFKHRYLLNDKAAKKIHAILKEKQSISLLMLELDQFHEILKSMQEGISSSILDQVDKKIESVLRSQDMMISLGGGKYMIILPKTSKAAATVLAEDLQSLIEMTPIQIENDFVHMSISIGIASRHVDEIEDRAQSIQQLNRLANLARGYVIESKHSGGQIISDTLYEKGI